MLKNNSKSTDIPQALDHPVTITRFPTLGAYSKKIMRKSMRELAVWVEEQTAATKDKLPWIKLATLGNEKSAKGCLRTNDNMDTVTGLEGDYDGERMTPETARAKLKKARVAALIYTTGRHTPEKPRWRVLCPFSGPLSPDAREELMARLNGIFGGVLDPASFTLSQAYYAGSVDGGEPVKTYLVDGEFIDKVEGLTPIYRHGGKTKPNRIAAEPAEDQSDIPQAVQHAQAMLETAKAKITKAQERTPVIFQQACWMGGFVACNTLSEEEVLDALSEAAGEVGHQATYGEDATERTIRNGLAYGEQFPLPWFDPVSLLDECWTPEELAAASVQAALEELDRIVYGDDRPKSHLIFLSPSECEDLPSRRYVIKGLLAEGDVGTIVGAPGAAKSVGAPYLGFRVAQGENAFGRRTKQGRVFYVAAEDGHGMTARVKALKAEYGDAEDFRLLPNVSDLLAPDSRDLKALTKAVKDQRPALIIIDTIAIAFPGLEENDSKSMGRVVKVARNLTKWGAAVLLVHHDTKDGNNGLPRGHSILNGAVDVNIHLTRSGTSVTGKLTKNRNGSTDEKLAFTVSVMPFGEDEDGDPKTVAFCREADATDMPVKETKLSPSAKAALTVFHEVGNGAPVDESVWRDRAIADRKVSAAEDRDGRRRTFKRAVEELTRKDVLVFDDGKFAMADSPERWLTDDDV